MQPAPVSPAVEIAVKALMLRRRDPTCPALQVMDEAIRLYEGGIASQLHSALWKG